MRGRQQDRQTRTVPVADAEWTAYRAAEGADKLLRHIALFYAVREAPSGPTLLVQHPLLSGSLPY